MKRDRLTAAAAVALGVGMAVNALLGPLVLGVIRFHESQRMETQLLGGELTSLFLAAPLAVVAGILWWRGVALAPVLTLGPAGFAVYTYVQFVLVPDYSRYAGNNEWYFPLYLTLVMLGWSLAWRSWRELSARPIDARGALGPGLRRAVGVLFVVTSAAFAMAWIASIATVLVGPAPGDYLEHPTAFWLIRLMDLGFVIPVGLLVGIGLLRRATWAARGTYAFIGMQVLLTCAVAGMAIRMWIRHDPEVTLPLLAVSTLAATGFVITYAMLIRAAASGGLPVRPDAALNPAMHGLS